MRSLCFAQADNFLRRQGLYIDKSSRLKLAKALGAAIQRASLSLEELASERLTPDEVPALSSSVDDATILALLPLMTAGSSKTGRGKAASVTMTGLFAAWWREAEAAGRKPSTHESYSNTVKGFVAFLEHDDATRISAEDVVAYKDHRLSTPSPRTGRIPSPKTVKDSDLSALKTLFAWAVMNRKLPMNPAAGLTIKVGQRAQVRPKGFVEAEAHAILSAALTYSPALVSIRGRPLRSAGSRGCALSAARGSARWRSCVVRTSVAKASGGWSGSRRRPAR